ncbi:MAG: tetratricopeptide repeat protein [Candidatus Wallbacteria bacterium]
MNLRIYFLALMLLIVPSFSYATEETSLEALYKDFNNTLLHFDDGKPYSEYCQDISKLMELAVKIIEKNPGSYEAYDTLLGLPSEFNLISEEPRQYYKKLKEECYADLSDVNKNMAAKIVFMRITYLWGEFAHCDEDICKSCVDNLKKMKNECIDKNYAALATASLFDFYTTGLDKNDYRKEFLEKFPKHPAVCDVKLNIAFDNYENKKYRECIEEINKLLNEYKNDKNFEIFELPCYHGLGLCYIELNDIETARKYLDLILQKAPESMEYKLFKKLIERESK